MRTMAAGKNRIFILVLTLGKVVNRWKKVSKLTELKSKLAANGVVTRQ